MERWQLRVAAEASAARLRIITASPCALTLQRRDEPTWRTSEFHTPVHEKKSERLPIASKPAIKKSRRNSAAQPRSGRGAVQRRSRRRRAIHSTMEKKAATSCSVLYRSGNSYLDWLTLCEGLTLGGSVPTRLPYHVIHTSRLRMKQLAKPSRGTCYASAARASKAACQNTTIFHGRV
jgi:hypothetical protein